MEHYTPTLYIRETSKNIKGFVKAQNDEVWKIFKPLLPFIAGLHLLDAVISDLFFSDNELGFGIGGIIASYFYTCLVISWHRVVIHGPDNYVPMNPFKPQRHELVFVGVGLLIGLALLVSGFIMGAMFALLKSPVIVLIGVFVLFALLYLMYKIMFFFPAKAVNAQLTLKEAYDMSKGYLWKFINASAFASFKLLLLVMAYMFVMGFGAAVWVGINGEQAIENASSVVGFIVMLPMSLYFQPLLTVIGVTAVSNYYLYAMRNAE